MVRHSGEAYSRCPEVQVQATAVVEKAAVPRDFSPFPRRRLDHAIQAIAEDAVFGADGGFSRGPPPGAGILNLRAEKRSVHLHRLA